MTDEKLTTNILEITRQLNVLFEAAARQHLEVVVERTSRRYVGNPVPALILEVEVKKRLGVGRGITRETEEPDYEE